MLHYSKVNYFNNWKKAFEEILLHKNKIQHSVHFLLSRNTKILVTSLLFTQKKHLQLF